MIEAALPLVRFRDDACAETVVNVHSVAFIRAKVAEVRGNRRSVRFYEATGRGIAGLTHVDEFAEGREDAV